MSRAGGRAARILDDINIRVPIQYLEGVKPVVSDMGFRKDELTAAHRTLPFGTRVRVTYLENGKPVEVVINDRGPHAKGRLIDLSGAAAEKIGLIDAGHGRVKLEILE